MSKMLRSPLKFVGLFALLALLLNVVFTVPAAAQSCTWTHRVRYGDTLSRIAQSYETTTRSLIALNPQITNANVIVEGVTICVSTTEAPPPTYPTSYTVAFGDSLEMLAERFGITLRDLVRANGIGNPNLIVEGESIAVPKLPAATPAS